jgi:hypothetical protein
MLNGIIYCGETLVVDGKLIKRGRGYDKPRKYEDKEKRSSVLVTYHKCLKSYDERMDEIKEEYEEIMKELMKTYRTFKPERTYYGSFIKEAYCKLCFYRDAYKTAVTSFKVCGTVTAGNAIDKLQIIDSNLSDLVSEFHEKIEDYRSREAYKILQSC